MGRLNNYPFIKKVYKVKTNIEKNKYNLPFLVRVIFYIPFAYLDIINAVYRLLYKLLVSVDQKLGIFYKNLYNDFKSLKNKTFHQFATVEKSIKGEYTKVTKNLNFGKQTKSKKKTKKAKNTLALNFQKINKSINEQIDIRKRNIIKNSKSAYKSFKKPIIAFVIYLKTTKVTFPTPKINFRSDKSKELKEQEKSITDKKNAEIEAKKEEEKSKELVTDLEETEDEVEQVGAFRKTLINIYNMEVVHLFLFPFRIFFNILRAIFSFELRIKVFSFKTVFVIAFIFVFYIISVVYFSVLKDIPDPETLNKYDPSLTTNIYDRKGNLLYRVYQDEDRTLVKLDDIPQVIIDATLSIEDASFYEHNGLSTRGIARAAKKNYLEDDVEEGGSTITQQLVKNVLLSPERTYERKIKEAVLSVEVERRFSKDQILEMYLNKISYGGTAYGIRAASNKYFNKDLSELTLAEASYLAGLPAAPTMYSPFGSTPELGKERQYEVLRRMVELGYVNPIDAQEAYLEDLNFNDNAEYMRAPHFVNYVISELEKKYGQKLVAQGGLDVYTSIDLDLQNKLEQTVLEKVWEFGNNNVSNGAVIVTDPHTGEILAMVGSIDYWDTSNDGNVNVTVSPRQPGSSIKPLMYAYAFESGYNPNYKLNDSPISYAIPGQKAYTPSNYDSRFHGVVTIKQALANSYNVPAVKMLDKLGVNNFIDFAEKLGITTWQDRSRYGLSLTLGAGEVRMIDMAQAYGVFANEGKFQKINPILKIYDPYGNVVEENGCVDLLKESPSILTKKKLFEVQAIASSDYAYRLTSNDTCSQQQVINESTAFYISDILSDNNARATAFGTQSNLYIPEKQVAVKSGTTQNLKDNWAVGYTNDYVVVAWIGNNDGEVMRNVVSGYHGASNIWRATFDILISDYDVSDKIQMPSNLIEVEICPYTNTLTCSGCPSVKQYFVKGEEPTERCNSDEVKKILEEIEKQNKKDDESNDDQEV